MVAAGVMTMRTAITFVVIVTLLVTVFGTGYIFEQERLDGHRNGQ